MAIDPNVIPTLVSNYVLRLDTNPNRTLYYEVLNTAPDGPAGEFFRSINDPVLQANWTATIDAAFALYGQVLNVTFLPAPSGTRADIRVGTGVTPGAEGYMFQTTRVIQKPDGTFEEIPAPDIIISNAVNGFNTPVPGTYAFATLLHETGHALGLKHPVPLDPEPGSADVPPYLTDYPQLADKANRAYTIMAGNLAPGFIGAFTQPGAMIETGVCA